MKQGSHRCTLTRGDRDSFTYLDFTLKDAQGRRERHRLDRGASFQPRRRLQDILAEGYECVEQSGSTQGDSHLPSSGGAIRHQR
jgi:hypothetical protein